MKGRTRVALVASMLVACGPPVPPNIIIITVDTLRADHLALHGYARPTSSNLERFARESTWYKRARTTAPWTLPAHASLFTGLYPLAHGAQMIDRQHGASPKIQLPLRDEATTLAEVLRDAG